MLSTLADSYTILKGAVARGETIGPSAAVSRTLRSLESILDRDDDELAAEYDRMEWESTTRYVTAAPSQSVAWPPAEYAEFWQDEPETC